MSGTKKRARRTQGFIDSSSLHGAFSAFILGLPASKWNAWDSQSLLECTHLLLFDNIRIVPGPTRFGGAMIGYESTFVEGFPEIIGKNRHLDKASQLTHEWLKNSPDSLKMAWTSLNADPNHEPWARHSQDLFWVHHSQSNLGLFQAEYIPAIAHVLGPEITVSDLKRIHALSKDPNIVGSWRKADSQDDVVTLVRKAHVIAGLIRGKHHENVARLAGGQLVPHPHRLYIGSETLKPAPVEISESEQIFCKLLIGSALLEGKAEDRIKAWRENIRKAKIAIAANAIVLPQTVSYNDAERFARDAAKRIEIRGTHPWKESVLTWMVTANVAQWLNICLGPWAALATGGAFLFLKLKSGRSIGEELAILDNTKENYRRLGNAVPGRIERTLKFASR